MTHVNPTARTRPSPRLGVVPLSSFDPPQRTALSTGASLFGDLSEITGRLLIDAIYRQISISD